MRRLLHTTLKMLQLKVNNENNDKSIMDYVRAQLADVDVMPETESICACA